MNEDYDAFLERLAGSMADVYGDQIMSQFTQCYLHGEDESI